MDGLCVYIILLLRVTLQDVPFVPDTFSCSPRGKPPRALHRPQCVTGPNGNSLRPWMYRRARCAIGKHTSAPADCNRAAEDDDRDRLISPRATTSSASYIKSADPRSA